MCAKSEIFKKEGIHFKKDHQHNIVVGNYVNSARLVTSEKFVSEKPFWQKSSEPENKRESSLVGNLVSLSRKDRVL